MTHRRVLRAVAVVLLAAGGSLLAPAASRAATIESGWWWRANTGGVIEAPAPAPSVTLPATPPAPPAPPNAEGGLQVAALPDGALAIAAVRVDEELTSITLRVAPNGDANGENAKLVACAAATPWVPVTAGPWTAKPVVACDLINGGGSVAGIQSEDGATWTFPVAPLADDGKTDVVIVPLADSDLAPGVAEPFQLVFIPPTPNDLVVAPVSEAESSEESSTDDGLDGLYDANPTFDPSFGASVPVAPVVKPALGRRDQAPVLPVFAADASRDTGSQLAGAALVLVGLAGLFWASRQPTPPIRSLVAGEAGREIPVPESQVGGLGRFARPRIGRPPSLQ